MAKLTRVTGKIFGETASVSGNDPEIGQFGSAKAGTYNGTGDVATIQGLSAWSNGWIDAVTPTQQFPTLPEMTGVHKVLSYQNAYLLQQGIAEWDSATDYHQNCYCAYNGFIYISLVNNNTNHNPASSPTYWDVYSSISDDRLHALKSYLDEGELLTDSEGLADVTSYAHSTFDLSKFTVTGSASAIINSEGILSGTNASNYVTKSLDFSSANAWEIKYNFTTPASLPIDGRITDRTSGSTDLIIIRITSGNSGKCGISLNVNSQAIFNLNNETFSITTNTNYTVKIGYDGTSYYAKYNTGGSDTTIKTVTSSVKWSAAQNHYIGRGSGGDQYYTGSIDLKQFSITVDGADVFSGNKTGTDTYTINGSTVSVPYTLSKTGSKIVDSSYRTQVTAVYNEFGYAPYYTLLEGVNYTLPQGELYGMINKQAETIPAQYLCQGEFTIDARNSYFTTGTVGTNNGGFVVSTNSITIPYDGFYLITYTLVKGTNGTGSDKVEIHKNGTAVYETGSESNYGCVAGIYYADLKSGDLIQIYGNSALTYTGHTNYYAIRRIGG